MTDILTDDQHFAEIEAEEINKRRGTAPEPSCVAQAYNGLRTLFQDIKDGFSLPKGASIKYAR